ncbi:MAG: phosphoribosyltransferase [Candidatus Anstonellales archaeon]
MAIKFSYITWSSVEKSCAKLGDMIKKDFEPDVLVGISRGGLVPVRLLSDKLGNSNIGIMRVVFYKGAGKTIGFPKIVQPLNIDVKGKKVLVVDDIVDTGMSMQVAIDHIKRRGAKEIRVAVIDYKQSSSIKPHYYANKASKWIVYPWMKEETKRERIK